MLHCDVCLLDRVRCICSRAAASSDGAGNGRVMQGSVAHGTRLEGGVGMQRYDPDVCTTCLIDVAGCRCSRVVACSARAAGGIAGRPWPSSTLPGNGPGADVEMQGSPGAARGSTTHNRRPIGSPPVVQGEGTAGADGECAWAGGSEASQLGEHLSEYGGGRTSGALSSRGRGVVIRRVEGTLA